MPNNDYRFGLGNWHLINANLADLIENDDTADATEQRCAILKSLIAKNGLTVPIINEICTAITMATSSNDRIYYSKRMGGFVVNQWNTAEDLIEEYGNHAAKFIMKVWNGDEEACYVECHDGDIFTFIDDHVANDPEATKIVMAYAKKTVRLKTIAASLEVEISDLKLSEIAMFLRDEMDNEAITQAAIQACCAGYESGTESEMIKDLYLALENPNSDVPGTLVCYGKQIKTGKRVDRPWFHGRTKKNSKQEDVSLPTVFHVIDVDEILQCLSEPYNIRDGFISPFLQLSGYGRRNEKNYINVDEPYNGWNDFDADHAMETFKDNFLSAARSV